MKNMVQEGDPASRCRGQKVGGQGMEGDRIENKLSL